MARNTAIEWADHTVNFWWGCTKISPACLHCYAERQDAHFHPSIPHGLRFQGEAARASHWGSEAPRMIRIEAARREALRYEAEAVSQGCRFRVFANSMADFFEDRRDLDQARLEALEVMRLTPHLDWLLLTKRPGRVLALLKRAEAQAPGSGLSDWFRAWLQGVVPPNVWIGATVEDQAHADVRIPELVCVPAIVRFISCEPLLGPLNLRLEDCWRGFTPNRELIHWVICGGESGPQARPMHPDWARGLRDQCQAAGVPFLLKQLGEWGPSAHRMDTGESTYRVFRDVDHWAAKAQGWMVPGDLLLDAAGKTCRRGADLMDGQAPFTVLRRIGKKAAGRALDGREHLEFPEARQ